MKYYNVTFKWYDTDTYCSNIAKAECAEDVKAHYAKYDSDPTINEASSYEVEAAKERGKPIVTCPHIEAPATLEAMTDPGQPTAEDLAEIDRQQQEAENARRAAEHEEELREREKMLNARCNGRRLIEAEQDAHPIKEGEPVVCINWSEHPAFYAWDEDALILSLEAAENILHRLDAEQNATRETEQGHGWYYKTKFTITGKDESGEEFSYTGRYDLGDNDGGLIEHIRAFAEYYRTHDNFGHDILHPEESTEQTRFAEYLAGFLAARATA